MKISGRRQDRVECDIILNKYERGAMNIVHAENISLGGMRFRKLLEPYINRDGTCRLEVALPGQETPLSISAERVYEDSDYVGVKFTNISHHHFLRLREWLHAQIIRNELPAFP